MRRLKEIALENTYFYELLGLKFRSQPCRPRLPCHSTGVSCALRYTCENASEEATSVSLAKAETDFLECHLFNWVPIAKTKLDRASAPGFPALITLLVQFLSHRHEGWVC